MDESLRSKIIILAVIIFVVRLITSHIYDPSIHRGAWYKVKVPEGWKKEAREDEVFFYSPQKDYLGNSEAIFSIYGFKSRGALFMDLFFPDVLGNLAQQNGKILNQGEIKIDTQISKWVLFRSYDPDWIIWSFFIIDEFNRLTKIQFLTRPEHFKKYRTVFEAFKDSIKFKQFF